MPRKLRIQYPGAVYHVMNRGDQREAIFRDEEDRHHFLSTLGEACQKTEWQVHAYCLMSNHFHLVLETPQPNLAKVVKPESGQTIAWCTIAMADGRNYGSSFPFPGARTIGFLMKAPRIRRSPKPVASTGGG